MSDAKHRTGFIGMLFLVFFCSFLFPQSKDTKKEASHKDQPSYSVKVNSVVINATVTDKAGNPVTDLTESDFRVYDDGKPQKIQTFALESFGPPESEETKAAGVSPKRAESEQKVGRPRLISIVIDDLTMDTALGINTYLDFPRMIDAVKKFINNDVGPMDQVAILSGSRRVQFPFSNDKQRLLEEVSAVLRKLNPDTPQRPCNYITDLEAWQMSSSALGINQSPYFTQLANLCWLKEGTASPDDQSPVTQTWTADDPSAPAGAAPSIRMDPRKEVYLGAMALRTNGDGEFRTRNLLYTILQNIRTLKHFEGTRMVVLFSDGFISQRGTPAAYQLQELIDMALRSGIVLNTVSTRSISTAIWPQQWINVMIEDNTRAEHSPLIQMANETGGLFSYNNNMYKPLQTVAHRRSFYYILTYAMPPHKAAGSYNKIKLEVTRPGLEISYRKGYYTPKEELTVQSGKKEDIVDALNAPGNMNEIPMTLAYNYSQEDDSTYAVSFITNVNIRGLQFPQEDDRRKNQISLVLAAFDEADHYISGLEKAIDFQLMESSYADLRERGLTSRVELKLPMGQYKIKAVVRENAQGKMGSIAKSVEIP